MEGHPLVNACTNDTLEEVRALIETYPSVKDVVNVECDQLVKTTSPPPPLIMQLTAGHPSGLTPLLAACFSGHVEVAAFLVDNGSDVNSATKESGRTPLYAAAQEGHRDIIRLLIAAGAEVDKASESSN
eukprot:gene24073-31626_t